MDYSLRMPGGCRQGKEKMKAAIMVPGADGGTWDVHDVQRPVVTAGQVPIRLHASSLNRAEFADCTLRLRPG
jgi:NADPH:quinone reductase-like Zn-dependent oxidoreductase